MFKHRHITQMSWQPLAVVENTVQLLIRLSAASSLLIWCAKLLRLFVSESNPLGLMLIWHQNIMIFLTKKMGELLTSCSNNGWDYTCNFLFLFNENVHPRGCITSPQCLNAVNIDGHAKQSHFKPLIPQAC